MSRRNNGLTGWTEREGESLSLIPRPLDEARRPRQQVGPRGGRSTSERDSSSRLPALIAAGLLLVAPQAQAQTPQKPKPVIETAVICVTGSVNGHPYASSTVVFSDGAGAIVDGQGHGLGDGPARSHRLFNQLKTSLPLVGLPVRQIKRSRPSGTTIRVIFRGEETPDLMRAGNDQARALKTDVTALLAAVN